MPVANDTQTALRLPRELLARVERVAKQLGGRPQYAGLKITPADVMRMAMVRGLDALEAHTRKR